MKTRKTGWARASLLLPAFVLACFSQPAEAQFRQYTPPGDSGGSGGSRQKQLEEEMAEARWRAGPLRLAPWLGIPQAQYVDNVFAASDQDPGADAGASDLTATFGLGLTAYLPIGSKVIWTAQVAPEYVWWQDQSERNQLSGRYGTGVFADLNRLRLEVLAGRTERQQRFTSEALQLGVLRQDRAEVDVELRLAGGLWLFAGGSFTEFEDRTDSDDPRITDFGRIDREETIRRGGLAYVFPNDVRIALGIEETETDLAPGARPLSSDGTSPVLEIRAPGERLEIGLELAQRELEPVAGSQFVPFDETAGTLRLAFRPGWRLRFELYGRSQPVLSLDESYSHFTEQRIGLAISAPFAEERLQLRLAGEIGNNDYQGLAAGVPDRRDDVTAWSVEATMRIADPLRLTTGLRSLDLDSNLPGLDRTVEAVLFAVGLELGSDFLWK